MNCLSPRFFRGREDGHQLLENQSESPRRGLQHRLPEKYTD